ncbi:thioredoxin family protein [bacterium]|nr:thioredoxin family protein [bacterium]
MYHKLVRNICFIVVSTLLFSVLGCSSCCNGEKQTHQEEQLNSKTETEIPAQESKTTKVTFIELGSVNCIPCKMMQPIMKEIEEEYPDVKVIFYDVWTSEGRPYGQKYGIRAIPTQVFLDKDGKEFFRHMGFFSKEEIVKILKKQGVE